MITRRQAARIVAATPALLGPSVAATWSDDWDRAVLLAALAAQNELFDASQQMLTRQLGPQYQYHTNLRSMVAHPTRSSLEYALYLLEAGGAQRQARAEQVLDRVLALQDTDKASKWYGLWGWYLEEPPPRMSPADWNWADFNGATLLLIEHRHGARLPDALRERVRQAIGHAAYSVRRRNVRMGYTNIAVKGTFVTLAAAELLGYQDLREYAHRRMYRLGGYIDQTGSFEEYNSPTYMPVTIADLTRLMMLVRSMEMRKIAGKIHDRAWLHFARHWHAPTRQLAGPMSRCYHTDIGSPLWLQKALQGRLEFATIDDIKTGKAPARAEVAVLDLTCPNTLVRDFLGLKEARQHRELFRPAKPPEPPLEGTTWLAPAFCLGSANKADFWVQRRPLLAYWGGPERPARHLRLRLVKDDYDFSSGLFYSVQRHNCVLGFLNFRSPGGDKHISLDPIRDGAFECMRLALQADLTGVPRGADFIVSGKATAQPPTELHPGSRIVVDLGGAYLWIRFPRAVFGKETPLLRISRDSGVLSIALELLREAKPVTVRWADVKEAWAGVALVMAPAEEPLREFSTRCALGRFESRFEEDKVRLIWQSPAGRLWLDGHTGIAGVAEQNGVFRAGVRSGPVPVERLSDERLIPAADSAAPLPPHPL